MKLILLTLLISFSSFAQWKVEIYKPDEATGKLINGPAIRDTKEEVEEWLEFHKKNNSFGKPAVTETRCEPGMIYGENCEEVIIKEAEKFEVIGPVDITAQVEAEKESKRIKEEKLTNAKKVIKEFDLNAVTSIEQLVPFLEALKAAE